MRVCIDARNLVFEEEWAGTTLYTVRLIEALARIDPETSYVLYLNFLRPHRRLRAAFLERPNVRLRVLHLPRRWADPLCDLLRFPVDLLTGRLTVLHGPAYELLSHWTGGSVVTIHDLTFHRFPQWLRAGTEREFRKDCYSAIRRADLLITVSAFIAGELQEELRVPAERIRTIPHGLEERFRRAGDAQQEARVRDRYGLRGPYILTVGTLEPRKNLGALWQAYTRLAKGGVVPHALAVAGKQGWGDVEWRRLQAAEGLDGRLLLLGYVPPEDLPALYRGADLFVFPSVYEGFGLPLLEAMGCGTPILAGGTSAIPEVVGDAAVLVDVTDPDRLAEGIEGVLRDEAMRAGLARRGRARAQAFIWEKSARRHLEVYREFA